MREIFIGIGSLLLAELGVAALICGALGIDVLIECLHQSYTAKRLKERKKKK